MFGIMLLILIQLELIIRLDILKLDQAIFAVITTLLFAES